MKPPRRTKRVLSGDDIRLWGEVAKLVTPLRGRTVLATSTPSTEPTRTTATPAKVEQPPTQVRSRTRKLKLGDLASSPRASPAKPTPVVQRQAPGPGLERKERRALQRGTLPIEARIDLHGLYQAQAHTALIAFIARSQTAGHSRVLVVTGKGGDDAALFSARGVLRRSVPHWLTGPELREIVLGFEEAGRQHGGSGALYVRLKRHRGRMP